MRGLFGGVSADICTTASAFGWKTRHAVDIPQTLRNLQGVDVDDSVDDLSDDRCLQDGDDSSVSSHSSVEVSTEDGLSSADEGGRVTCSAASRLPRSSRTRW